MADDGMLNKRIYGALYGNCIGDAIGLLTEFMTKDEAKTYYGKNEKQLEYEHKVPDFHRSRWKVGDWTDDSDQMILMMQSITEKQGNVDAVDYGNKVLNWARNGFPELGDFAGMGLGATTHHVLKHKEYTTNPHSAAKDIWEKSGRFAAPNGAVMRTSVMGIYQYDDLDKVKHNTLEFCKVTHADYRCQASCVAVTTAIAMMLQGKHFDEPKGTFDVDRLINEAYQTAKHMIPKNIKQSKEFRKELKNHMNMKEIKDLKLDEHGKIGYTYKTLGAGFWALRQDDFREAMQKVVMEAGDADTNGAVAGALLGCKLGQDKLPPSWYNGLVFKKWLDDIIGKFLELPSFNEGEKTVGTKETMRAEPETTPMDDVATETKPNSSQVDEPIERTAAEVDNKETCVVNPEGKSTEEAKGPESTENVNESIEKTTIVDEIESPKHSEAAEPSPVDPSTVDKQNTSKSGVAEDSK